ncbi:hypothetical protein [Brevundimonas goettingensis]|uniref:Uncharacterized protein n=1 Tax=Brevundimonas goettingensis TaxID=2774190 RepID=A0A975GX79_9CAUL|nr:hypothetical protein [Brevundimonas goettingensis]QTC90250.1 hypothetical protein IFJ75_13290 [Brevundimonas goettingensis]
MDHEKPPAIKNPARARRALVVIVGVIAGLALVTFILAFGHQEKKAPAPAGATVSLP